MKRALKTLLLLAFLCKVAAAAEPRMWTGIAGVDGLDKITQIHVRNLLTSNGIISLMGGSLLYTVEVPADKAEQAIRLLHGDALKLRYDIFLATNIIFVTNGVVTADEGKRKQLISGSPVSSVLRKKQYDPSTSLGRFLRSKDISNIFATYPYIVSLSARQRQYLATPKSFSTGYDVKIELQASPNDSEHHYRGWYQVYDSGNSVQFGGANYGTFIKK